MRTWLERTLSEKKHNVINCRTKVLFIVFYSFQEVCYTLVKEFVMLTALKSKKISMQGESTKHDLRIWSCALHPKFPYLCVHGDLGADGEEILNVRSLCQNF